MRRALVAAAVLAASCSGQGEVIPTPAPAPEVPATTAGIKSTALVAAEEPTTTTIEVTTTTTTEPATVPMIPPRPTTTYLQPQATTRPSTQLASIRACESGGNYSTNTGNGYYGAYQFSWGTWASVGGSGNPALASPAEQDMRAQMMIDSGRRGEWPNC